MQSTPMSRPATATTTRRSDGWLHQAGMRSSSHDDVMPMARSNGTKGSAAVWQAASLADTVIAFTTPDMGQPATRVRLTIPNDPNALAELWAASR